MLGSLLVDGVLEATSSTIGEVGLLEGALEGVEVVGHRAVAMTELEDGEAVDSRDGDLRLATDEPVGALTEAGETLVVLLDPRSGGFPRREHRRDSALDHRGDG